jgi:uncharacterized protein YkwD
MRPTSRFLALSVPAVLTSALLAGCAADALGAPAAAEARPAAAPAQPAAGDAPREVAPVPVTAPAGDQPSPVVAPRTPMTPVPPPPPEPAAVARDAGTTARDAVRPRVDGAVGSVGAAAPAPEPAAVAPSGGYAASLVSGVNAERAAAGLPALRSNGCAQAAAQRWAEHLAATGEFAHQDIGAVLRTCSPATAAGENIARSPGGAGEVVSSWMASPGHRANILDAGYTHLGSAAVQMDDGRWVAVHVFLTL